MEREEAVRRIGEIVGKDLVELAKGYGVTVKAESGKTNKGWAGHVIERHLGLPLNSAQSPNFGSWELKLASLRRLRSGELAVKETIAITMIDPVEVMQKPFKDSHLFNKLRKIVAVSRIWESSDEKSSILYGAATFDLDDPIIYEQVRSDYELVRQTLRDTHRSPKITALSGKMGVLVQPRTKGAGHGSVSRAFYARPKFVAHIVQLSSSKLTTQGIKPTAEEVSGPDE